MTGKPLKSQAPAMEYAPMLGKATQSPLRRWGRGCSRTMVSSPSQVGPNRVDLQGKALRTQDER